MKQPIYIAGLLLGVLVMACEKEPDTFSVQKLQFRQDVDEAILEIDETLEDLYEKAAAMETEQDSANSDIPKLKELRADLYQKLQQMETITRDDWPSFKNDVDEKLEEVTLSLDKIKLDDVDIQPPYPATTRIK